MSTKQKSLVLSHLRHIRGKVDRIADDMADPKQRMASIEQAMTIVKREVNLGDETSARQQLSLDKLSERIERIERRLELA